MLAQVGQMSGLCEGGEEDFGDLNDTGLDGALALVAVTMRFLLSGVVHSM